MLIAYVILAPVNISSKTPVYPPMHQRHQLAITDYRSPRRSIVAVIFIVLTQLSSVAHAQLFNPRTAADLVDAFKQASTNLEDDIIDLGGQTFELTGELMLDPDEGHGLLLRFGAIERPEDAEPFRLVTFRAVPHFVQDEGQPIVIDNIHFKNGHYHETSVADAEGGGGALLTNRKTIINNALFVNNQVTGNASGGAINHSKSLDIDKVLFVNNQAISDSDSQRALGGAILVDPGASLFVRHSYFLGNVADQGGAIYASQRSTNLSITRSAFDGNKARTLGGAVWSNVGDGDVRISNTSFIANSAPKGGGAFYTHSLFASVTLVHLTMWGNESDEGLGGGIRAFLPRSGSNLILRNSVLANNVGGNCSSTDEENLSFRDSYYNLVDDEKCGSEGISLHTGVASVFAGKFEKYGGVVPSLPIAEGGQANNLVPRDKCLDYDTRDIPRLDNSSVRDDFCDAGAFEYVPMAQIDRDGDEVRNNVDNCEATSNSLQSDIDEDGVGDACDNRDDRDSDNDNVLNFRDNCPNISNFLQLDINDNGIGDACEQRKVGIAIGPVIR